MASHYRPIEGIQTISGRKIRRKYEPQPQLLVYIFLFYCTFIICIISFNGVILSFLTVCFFFLLLTFEPQTSRVIDKHITSFIVVYHYAYHQDL